MEKSANSTKSANFTRLLKFLFSFAILLATTRFFAFAHIYSDYVFTPTDEYVFVGQNVAFEVTIPLIKPADILVTAQNLPEKVIFISSDKTEIFSETSGRATRVRIVYRFDDVGFFKMPPIASRIRYGAYNLKVESVNVLNNPETIQPIAKFSLLEEKTKPYEVGERIPLQLKVSFASKISSFSVNLLENSAMCRTKDGFSLPMAFQEFSTTEYPIADFDFIPLEEGILKVPQVSVNVCTWKGIEKTIYSVPMEFKITKKSSDTDENFEISKNVVLDNVNLASETKSDNIIDKIADANDKAEFTSGFYEANAMQNATENLGEVSFENTKNTVALIANFRILERNRIFNRKIIKERKVLEAQIGLKKTANEISDLYFYGFLLLFIVFFVLLVIGIVLKNKSFYLVVVAFLACIFICVLIFGINNKKEYALLLDQKIYSIPESDSNLFFMLPLGTRVKVKGKTNEWIYVNYSDTSVGWIRKDNLLFLDTKVFSKKKDY